MNITFRKFIPLLTNCCILLMSCFVLVSCANKVSNDDSDNTIKVTKQNIYNVSLSDFDKIKSNNNYDNLSFDNASIKLSPNITDFSEINMSYFENTQKDSLALFEKMLKETFANKISDDECFFNSPDIEVDFGDLTLEYPELYSPAYYQEIVNEKLPVDMYLYQTDTYQIHEFDQYFMMFPNCALLKMNRGNFMRAVEKNRNLAGWMPRDNYPLYELVSIDEYDRVINFNNGGQTIADSQDYCNSYFNNLKLTGENNFTFIVNETNVIETDSSHQALLFFLTRAYNGIPFDTLNSEGAFSAFSDRNEYYFDSSEALMCNTNEIEYYYLTVKNSNIISELKIEEIISLKSATDIISSYMTSNIKFNVESVSLVYSNMMVNSNEYQSTAKPTWKFILKNSNDNLTYTAFVDAENGTCHYYTF